MKVLLTVASLKPSYGGPAFSVSQLACQLDNLGLQVAVWTPDGSAPGSPLLGGKVQALGGDVGEALATFEPDILHDNGIWLAHNHRLAVLAGRLGIPRVVSPRGMLEPWAARHKGLKKAIAWRLYQRRDLVRSSALHATAEREAENLKALGLGLPVHVVPNGVDPVAPSMAKKADGPLTALFLGRIYPVKGLPMLVEAWGRVRPKSWTLKIAGPDEAGHKAEVEAVIQKHQLEDAVEFLGPVGGEAKAAALSSANLFILPSYSESFGMAVGEALAAGLPVLTTTGTPWPQLEARDCGWWVEPTVDGLAAGLAQALSTPPEELRLMGARGAALIAEDYSWPSAAQKFRTLYERLLTP